MSHTIDPVEIAKSLVTEALGVCADVMRDKYAPHADKLRASGMILERALGRTITPAPTAGKRGIAKQLAVMHDDELKAVLLRARSLREAKGGVPPAAGTLPGGVLNGSPLPIAYPSEALQLTAIDDYDPCS